MKHSFLKDQNWTKLLLAAHIKHLTHNHYDEWILNFKSLILQKYLQHKRFPLFVLQKPLPLTLPPFSPLRCCANEECKKSDASARENIDGLMIRKMRLDCCQNYSHVQKLSDNLISFHKGNIRLIIW